MKKGRHRRYEEARAMKRGPDLDIEAIFTDLESDRPSYADDSDSSGSDTYGDSSYSRSDEDDDEDDDNYG